MERTDANRTVAFEASALRTSLYSSALAWNVANLVIGLGALVFVLGLVLLGVALVTRRPEQVLLSMPQRGDRDRLTPHTDPEGPRREAAPRLPGGAMRLLVVEDEIGDSVDTILALVDAGHRVVRCQPVGGEWSPAPA